MRIVITGADGFVGRNLSLRLRETGKSDIVSVTRSTPAADLPRIVADADFVFHLAGTNRPKDPAEFAIGNRDFTATLCEALRAAGRPIPVAYTSSTQAALDSPYGLSKRAAEDVILDYGRAAGSPVYLFRLTNIFGKWARPDYNSAIATFCHNISRGLPIRIDDPSRPLRLIYIDDVVAALADLLSEPPAPGFIEAGPVYDTTVGEAADGIRAFAESRASMVTPPVGGGLQRALHATYLSYLEPRAFGYAVPVHADPRGAFVEMLKTRDSGQFSYFTSHPGITRGEHYHHSKTEKFLVIQGTARFGFRNIDSGDTFEMVTRGGDATIVETAPGWAHNVTNIGDDLLICMLWANEIFDRDHPDTVAAKVNP